MLRCAHSPTNPAARAQGLRQRHPRPRSAHLPAGTALAIQFDCYCGTYRQTARAVTQLYDAALKPSGLKITQFGILGVLYQHPESTTAELAEALGMDSTTLTRTLKIIVDRGWIVSNPGADKRARYWMLTDEGKEKLRVALPCWEGAQQQMRALAEGVDLEALNRSMFGLTEAVGKLGLEADTAE
jgi:DNA-binding MarR family transcriptional regulator